MAGSFSSKISLICILIHISIIFNNYTNLSSILYLGIQIEKSKEDLQKIVFVELENMIYNTQNKELNQVYNELIENFYNEAIYRFPSDLHITTVFDPATQIENESVKHFQDGKKINIDIHGIVIIPNKLVTFYVSCQTPVANTFPHITFLVGKDYKSKYSNIVLELVFEKMNENAYYYIDSSIAVHNSFRIFNNIELFGKNESIYVLNFANKKNITGKMKIYFKKNKINSPISEH